MLNLLRLRPPKNLRRLRPPMNLRRLRPPTNLRRLRPQKNLRRLRPPMNLRRLRPPHRGSKEKSHVFNLEKGEMEQDLLDSKITYQILFDRSLHLFLLVSFLRLLFYLVHLHRNHVNNINIQCSHT